MIDVDPDVEELVALAELQERYGVTGPQAKALLDHFGASKRSLTPAMTSYRRSTVSVR